MSVSVETTRLWELLVEGLLCTGERYPINRDAPEEGTDIWHDRPCPVHERRAA